MRVVGLVLSVTVGALLGLLLPVVIAVPGAFVIGAAIGFACE